MRDGSAPGEAGLRAASVSFRPSEAELRAFAEAMPTARRTRYGSLNVHTRVRDRSKRSTFVVTDDPDSHRGHSISRAEGERIARLQDQWLAGRDVVVVDGFVGHAEPHRLSARLVVERAWASHAAMQRHMYYDPVADGRALRPDAVTICTPGLAAPGWPDERVVAIWLEEGVTRVLGSDYFGEAKKAPVRLWCQRVHDAGGLVLHAGCTVVPGPDGPRSLLLVGPSGAGKTTITFNGHAGSRVVQDDFVGLLPGGRLLGSEDGCIEKTWCLDPDRQPAIHRAVTRPDAWLENVSQRGEEPDFSDPSWTRAGRGVFNMRAIDNLPPAQAPPLSRLLVLHRDHMIVPCVARLTLDQAAGYHMLRELRRGVVGVGRGVEPAIPIDHALQGNRLAELLAGLPAGHGFEAYVLNTGRIGGHADDERSKEFTLAYAQAVVAGIAAGTIVWDDDPDFGYQVATEVPDIDDPELLQPWRLFERQGRRAEYREEVARLKAERAAHLADLIANEGLDRQIAAAVIGRR
jgi:phosphoenolpyruvate carboxykinase (ATP)